MPSQTRIEMEMEWSCRRYLRVPWQEQLNRQIAAPSAVSPRCRGLQSLCEKGRHLVPAGAVGVWDGYPQETQVHPELSAVVTNVAEEDVAKHRVPRKCHDHFAAQGCVPRQSVVSVAHAAKPLLGISQALVVGLED